MSQAFDDDFDLDLEVREPGVYLFDPDGERTASVFERLGMELTLASTGSEIMAAAQKGELRGVVIAPLADEELRELFMVAFRGRFPEVPVVYIHPDADNPATAEELRAEGAREVIKWPLPSDVDRRFTAVFGALGEPPVERKASDKERQVLVRKLDAIDARSTLDLIPKKELEKAAEEATSLRSELTLVRERSQLLQRRIERLTQDLAAVTHQRDELKRKLKSGEYPRPASELTAEQKKQLSMIKKVGANAENFVWGVEQTIRFLEELRFEAGERKAPSLDSHIKILKLTRKLLTQLQNSTKGI